MTAANPLPIIELVNVTKSYRLQNGGRKYVLINSNIKIPARKIVGVMGRNGAGKSTTLRLISGTQDVDSGKVIRRGTISWPVGFSGSFHPELTGAQNTRFIARVYGTDTDDLLNFVKEFADLGRYIDMPFKTYSSGMRSRLAFGISMGIPFDLYLMDEVTAAGDTSFRDKCNQMLTQRLKVSGAIFVSHSTQAIKATCNSAIVLENGIMRYFDDIDEGLAFHKENMAKIDQ
ncbi:ABC transporter ATP-binding protein [Cypionkella sinensis]|uniref:ABC transporter ATP-binding protein n=1 Tax=Cypionkella sinensis TaxID=1756043 RepID=UPI0036335636